MASEAQIAANRANAARSTGPRTARGKARSSRNALKHGAFARKHGAFSVTLLSDESQRDFVAVRESYIALYQPANPKQSFLVAQMALSAWRLQRLSALEARIVSTHHSAEIDNREWTRTITAALRGLLAKNPSPARPSRPQDFVAAAYIRDSERGNAITKLARYQNSLERSYYRALHELEACRNEANANPD